MKLRVPVLILICSIGLAVMGTGCGSSKSTPTSPATSTPTPIPNFNTIVLSAYATIGNNVSFSNPMGIDWINGKLWVGDSSNSIQEWTTVGSSLITPITNYDTSIAYESGVYYLGFDPTNNNLYGPDYSHQQVAVYNAAGGYLTYFGNGEMTSPFTPPIGAAVNSAGTTVYVICIGASTSPILVYSINNAAVPPTYNYQTTFGTSGTGKLSGAFNLKFDPSGNLWVADRSNDRLAEFSPSGNYIKSFSAPSSITFDPVDMTFDGSGNTYAVCFDGGMIVKFDPSGDIVGQAGVSLLKNPNGITTDGSGHYWVTDGGHQQIVAFH